MARWNSESSNEHNLVDKYFGKIPVLVIGIRKMKNGDKSFRTKE